MISLKKIKEDFSAELKDYFSEDEIRVFFFEILFWATQKTKTDFYIHQNLILTQAEEDKFSFAVQELKTQKPIQYITNSQSFFSLDFYVDESVLIPRPETEELVQWAFQYIENKQDTNVLDICTGSGCISISIKKNFFKTNVFAVDICEKALSVARKNAKKNEVFINFEKKNVLEDFILKEKFDVIISNPPYVRPSEKLYMKANVLNFEPSIALFVEEENPLIFYEKISDFALTNLKKGGYLFFEINQYLSSETQKMLKEKGFNHIELRKDFRENDRMIKAQI